MTNEIFDIDLLFSPATIACAVLLLIAMAVLLIAHRKSLSGAQKALCVFGLALALAYLLFLLYLTFASNSNRHEPQPVSAAVQAALCWVRGIL